MAGNILFEAQLTSAMTLSSDTYVDATGMASGSVSVEGTDSLVLIITTITFDSDSADAGCWAAIFVDDVLMVDAMAGVDDNTEEPHSIQLAWAEKGLSAGNHDFDIRVKETEGGTWDDCILDVGLTRAVQVIEFKDSDVTTAIRYETQQTDEDATATTSFTVVDDLTTTFTTVTDAVYLVTSTVSVSDATSGSGDVSGEFRVMVDGVERQSAKAWNDSTSEGGSMSLFLWWEETASASTTFEIQWKEEQASLIATARGQEGAGRHMQVIEFSGSNVPAILAEARQTSSQSFSGSFQDVTGMDLNPTIDGTDALIIASGIFNIGTGGSDISCKVQLRLGGTAEIGGEEYADAGDEEGSVTLVFAETGIAAGSRNYDLQVQNGQSTCIGANSPSPTPQNMLQIVEFQAGGAGSFTENMTDELGMEDILTTVASFIIAFTDEVGIEDVVTISLMAAFTDEMGIDSVFEDLFSSRKAITDELGMDEIFDREISVINSFTDELGIDEQFTAGVSFTQADTDELGLDEIFDTVGSFPRSFTDEVGIEDTLVTLGSFNQAFTDELGLDEIFDIDVGGALTEDFTDELGLDEQFDTVGSFNIAFTDELGLDEIFAFMAGATITMIDEIGLEDTLDEVSSFNISFVDEMGIEDSIQISVGNDIMLIDELGLDDSLVFQLGVIYFTDELGIEDTVGTVEPLGLAFNAIMLSLNSPEFDRLGGSFAIICPANSTLTALLTNGTFICTPMSDFFP